MDTLLLTRRQQLARLIVPAHRLPPQVVLYSWATICEARALSIGLPNLMDVAEESLRGISALQEVGRVFCEFFFYEMGAKTSRMGWGVKSIAFPIEPPFSC